MSTKELLDKALRLKPEDRLMLVEGLIKSLDEPDRKLDDMGRGVRREKEGWKTFQWRIFSELKLKEI